MLLLRCVVLFISILHAEDQTKKVGLRQTRNDAGKVVAEVTYDDRGQEHGYTRIWFAPGRNDENPRLGLAEERYSVHGKRTGPHRRWYAPGASLETEPTEEQPGEPNLRDIRRYQYGKWHGVSQHWLADGTPDGARCYKCGERGLIEECSFDFADETQFAALCKAEPPSFAGRAPARK